MSTNKIVIVAFFLMGFLSLSACKDDMKEITTLDVSRAFSPTDLEARVVNRTGVRLNWTPSKNADAYTIEIFDNVDTTELTDSGKLGFSGTPVKMVDSVTADQLPYVITGLDGATLYGVRVKAMGNDVDDSKYISASFTTDAEQIFLPLDPQKLHATSVSVDWPAGEKATSIVITPSNITHAVTAEEIAAGEATISGLTGETAYTATLLNGTKTRGTITFTTLIDLGGAIAVSPTDNLDSLISNATGGETFALLPGTYNIDSDITVSKSISIKGAKPSDRPVVNGLVIRIKANAGLSLKDLVLDGTGSSGNQTIVYDEDNNAYGDFSMENCNVSNYEKGLFYVNKAALINSVTFEGNIIHDIICNGGDFIDFRLGLAKTFLFENNTVYNSAASRDLFRMDAGGSSNFGSETSIITIKTNTFYNVINSSSKRYLYIRLASHQIYFTKNIISNSDAMYTNQAATTISELSGNNYFNAPNFTGSTASNAQNDTGTYTTLDPGFADPASGNFAISNEDLKFNGIGALRWR